MSAPEIRFLACADGRRVAFSVQGTGPVLLCPAWWVSHLQRDRQDPAFAAFFDRLGAGMTLVMHDAPTTGLSDRSGPPATLSTAADILTRLAAELGAARYSLFAMSFAGPAALHHAAGNPAVSRIVFFGSLATGSALGPPEVRAAFAALVRAHWGRGARALADLMIPGADPQAVAALARLMRASATPE
ncbi:MAG: hypothetical protein KDK12_09010, partial [Rhodobacteraceae bacterium]|nr:hypothetical protein [Paracoccaceae bacterium]